MIKITHIEKNEEVEVAQLIYTRLMYDYPHYFEVSINDGTKNITNWKRGKK